MVYRILVASYTDSIYTLEFDPSKPSDFALSISSTLEVGFHPSWLSSHPSNPSIVYTGLEQPDGRLVAIKYNQEKGEGSVVADVSSGGHSPCTVLALEKEVLAGNYMGSSVGVYSITSNADQFSLKALQSPLKFSGTGPCKERQEMSHPHQVYLAEHKSSDGNPASSEVLVPDLGADKVWRLIKNKDGFWDRAGFVSFDEHIGGGPRHVVVYDSVLYTVLELTLQLTAHTFPPLPSNSGLPTSTPKLLASAPTLASPPECPPLTMLTAELVLAAPSATFPTPYLYASTRNVPRPGGDTISIFSTISPSTSAELKRVNEVETGLTHLRGFIFFGLDDRFLIAGGANGGGIKVFERVDGGKNLKELAHLPVEGEGAGLCPTGFLVL